jgi:hypothetical protein
MRFDYGYVDLDLLNDQLSERTDPFGSADPSLEKVKYLLY